MLYFNHNVAIFCQSDNGLVFLRQDTLLVLRSPQKLLRYLKPDRHSGRILLRCDLLLTRAVSVSLLQAVCRKGVSVR